MENFWLEEFQLTEGSSTRAVGVRDPTVTVQLSPVRTLPIPGLMVMLSDCSIVKSDILKVGAWVSSTVTMKDHKLELLFSSLIVPDTVYCPRPAEVALIANRLLVLSQVTEGALFDTVCTVTV